MSAEDHRLIDACLGGRTAAFAELIRRHHDRLYDRVLRAVGNDQDALDVIQETFVNAYKSLESYKGDVGFFAWLHGIADTVLSRRIRSAGTDVVTTLKLKSGKIRTAEDIVEYYKRRK